MLNMIWMYGRDMVLPEVLAKAHESLPLEMSWERFFGEGWAGVSEASKAALWERAFQYLVSEIKWFILKVRADGVVPAREPASEAPSWEEPWIVLLKAPERAAANELVSSGVGGCTRAEVDAAWARATIETRWGMWERVNALLKNGVVNRVLGVLLGVPLKAGV